MNKEQAIAIMIERGGKRWQKGNMDRIYFNTSALGLECTYYKTGNIHSAEFNGKSISNSEGYRMKAAKTYIDVDTWTAHGTHDDLLNALVELMDTFGAKEVEA